MMVASRTEGVEGERGRCSPSAVANRLNHSFIRQSHNRKTTDGYARERLQVCGSLYM